MTDNAAFRLHFPHRWADDYPKGESSSWRGRNRLTERRTRVVNASDGYSMGCALFTLALSPRGLDNAASSNSGDGLTDNVVRLAATSRRTLWFQQPVQRDADCASSFCSDWLSSQPLDLRPVTTLSDTSETSIHRMIAPSLTGVSARWRSSMSQSASPANHSTEPGALTAPDRMA